MGFTIIDNVLVQFERDAGSTEVIVPSNVKIIGKSAFYSCTGITSVYIPSSVQEIGDLAFAGCISLKAVVIEEGLKKIGDYAFANCGNIYVKFPKSVINRGKNILKGSFIVPSEEESYRRLEVKQRLIKERFNEKLRKRKERRLQKEKKRQEEYKIQLKGLDIDYVEDELWSEKTFSVSGSLNVIGISIIQFLVMSHSGKFVKNVSKADYLICNDETTKKIECAKKLIEEGKKITILSEEEFLDMYRKCSENL